MGLSTVLAGLPPYVFGTFIIEIARQNKQKI